MVGERSLEKKVGNARYRDFGVQESFETTLSEANQRPPGMEDPDVLM